MERWKEVALITATFHEPGLCADDDRGLSVFINGGSWIKYELEPFYVGSSERLEPSSLLGFNASQLSIREVMEQEREAIQQITAAERMPMHSTVTLLTVWECEAGWQYIPGEADEYDSNAQLVGYYKPKTLEYIVIEAL